MGQFEKILKQTELWEVLLQYLLEMMQNIPLRENGARLLSYGKLLRCG